MSHSKLMKFAILRKLKFSLIVFVVGFNNVFINFEGILQRFQTNLLRCTKGTHSKFYGHPVSFTFPLRNFAYRLNLLCHLSAHPLDSDKMAHHALFGVLKIFGKRFCNFSYFPLMLFCTLCLIYLCRIIVYFPCVLAANLH